MLVEVTWLKPHEEIKLKARDKLLDMTKRVGVVSLNQYWWTLVLALYSMDTTGSP